MRLGALDSLQRGLGNLRANWQLIPVVWLQTILNVGLALAALLPFVFVLDLEMPPFDGTPAELEAWNLAVIEHLLTSVTEPAFWLAVVSSTAVGLALLACTAFFQAGSYGVLVEGDRRVPWRRPYSAARAFRAFSWREFQHHGGRDLWPYFWLYNLMLAGWLLWIVLVLVVVIAVGLVGQQAGLAAGVAIGCAAVLPMGFLLFLFAFWMLLAQVEISLRHSGAWKALARSLGILVRRLPAALLLLVVFFSAIVALGLVFFMLSLPLNAGLAFAPGLRRLLGVGLQAVQWLINAGVQLVLAGTLVALYRGEVAGESSPREADA